ncbi:MAG: type transport system ATP-binding protein [Thermoleophilaceae bacterium]|nr:type transport system ATP-binding protein [Thermoleophilaceae bacterium]
MRWLVLILLVLVFPASALAADPITVKETPVSIPATQPTDEGAPVTLDGGVDIPSSGCPCPGVIINHGFLGNWKDSGSVARELASHGYVVLRYSSRGFGNTPGEVDLMGPKETQDLLDAVHWLNNPTSPVVGGLVTHNRIGQFGGSYGGAHAWALARSGDPAVRTVIPTATWSDIYDALLPNNVELLAYANGFYATGWEPTGKIVTNQELSTTNNYSQNMHRWVAEANAGVGLDDLRAGAAQRSVAGHYDQVKIPVFIIQGLNDGLFSANQAIDAYQALRGRKVKARLYLGGIGHPPSDGSLDSPEALHVETEVLAWLDHYLKGQKNGVDKLPPIEFSRANYFHNKWDGTTRSAKTFPFGPAKTLQICTSGPAGGTLASAPCPDATPAVAVNSYAGAGWDEEPVTGGYAEDLKDGFAAGVGTAFPDTRTAPPTLVYDSATLTAPLDLAGIPKLSLQVASSSGYQLDPKLYDVSPDGSAKLLTRGAFSEPVGSGALPHTAEFDAYGLSNLVPAGHKVRLQLQTADAPYLRPNTNPFAVAVFAGSTLSLPTAG